MQFISKDGLLPELRAMCHSGFSPKSFNNEGKETPKKGDIFKIGVGAKAVKGKALEVCAGQPPTGGHCLRPFQPTHTIDMISNRQIEIEGLIQDRPPPSQSSADNGCRLAHG